MNPKPGDVLRVDGRASVQFDGARALTFRVATVSAAPTYQGWVWLTGYVLDPYGAAVERREIYVQHDGLRRLTPRPRAPAGAVPHQATPGRRPAATSNPRPRQAQRV